jgi:hypothetical protein
MNITKGYYVGNNPVIVIIRLWLSISIGPKVITFFRCINKTNILLNVKNSKAFDGNNFVIYERFGTLKSLC